MSYYMQSAYNSTRPVGHLQMLTVVTDDWGYSSLLFHSLNYGFWDQVGLDAYCGQDQTGHTKIKTLRSTTFGHVLRDNQVTQMQLVPLRILCTFLIYFQKETLMGHSMATIFKNSDEP